VPELPLKPLSEKPPRSRILVRQLRGGKDFVSRMVALGVTEGAEVEVIRNYGDGTLICLVQDAHVTLGRGEALKVLVEEVSDNRECR